MKRESMVSQALAVLLSSLLAGCASYTPTSVSIPKVANMAIWQTQDDLTVAADPFLDADRQKAVFDADFSDAGVLPIQLYMKSQRDHLLLVRRSDIALVFPDGSQVRPAGATAVATKMDSIGGVVGATIAFGLIGFLASSSARDRAQAARLADYQGKEFQDATLSKADEAHGFVYFIQPTGPYTLREATLAVRFVDAKEASSFVVNLPLSGRQGPERAPTQQAESPAGVSKVERSPSQLQSEQTPETLAKLEEKTPAPMPSAPGPFANIAGMWSGKIEYGLHARTREGDWPVTVTIKDDGSYGATTLRQSTGKVQIAGGKYEIKLDIGMGVEAFKVALHDREGKRILKGVSHDGSKTIEMTQQNTPKTSERSESNIPGVSAAVTAPGATPFARIAGTWSGTIDGPESRAGWPDYTVTMTIREDGSYKGNTSYQNFAGTMQLAGDRLRFKAVTGFATRQQTVNVTLREQDGKRVLKGVSEDGLTRWELIPVKDW